MLIKNANMVDVINNKIINNTDILIDKGKIIKIANDIPVDNNREVIDAKNKLVCPGFIDMHVHLREPGREDKETIQTGSNAAAKGGFTTIVCMPNTEPVLDNAGLVRFVKDRAKTAVVNVFPTGCITKGMNGLEITEMADLVSAGIVAITEDGRTVMNSEVLRRAMEYSKMFDIPVLSHCEDISLSEDGVMNEGYYSTITGLKGIPNQAESIIVARDINLAQLTGTRIHIQHVSAKESIDIIKFAKKQGISVTAETAPHYFTLTHEALVDFDTNKKMNPPLRSKEDLKAIKKALADGTIDVIATDHAPHIEEEKDLEIKYAPFGIVGLETAVGLILTELYHKEKMDIIDLVKKLTINPAKILKLDKGVLQEGADADITILDLDEEWVVDKNDFKSKSKNTPFDGMRLKGKVVSTIVSGKMVFRI